MITPEFHHWHHADEPDAHNTNYSVFLPVWDLVFGTYFVPRDRRPTRLRRRRRRCPDGIVAQLRHPFARAARPALDRRATRSPTAAAWPARRAPRACARSPLDDAAPGPAD